MSGNFGWRGGSRDDDHASKGPDAFADARGAYTPGTKYTPRADTSRGSATAGPSPGMYDPPPVMPTAPVRTVDLAPRIHAFKAWNCVLTAMDTTGSMSSWRQELFARCALLYKKCEKLLGGPGDPPSPLATMGSSHPPDPAPAVPPGPFMVDGRPLLEIQFVGFGDADVSGDSIEVAPPGSGPELDDYLIQMRKDCSGGGNSCESSDMALLYADRMVTLPEHCRQKVIFIVTDEPHPGTIDPEHAKRWLGVTLQKAMPLADVVASLRARGWAVWCVLKPGGAHTQRSWTSLLGEERVVPIDDARRVVDVLIGLLAIQVGKFDAFTADLRSRHITPDNKFGPINVKTVMTSLSSASSVLGAAKPMRAPQTRRLLPAAPGSGTKSATGHPIIDVEPEED